MSRATFRDPMPRATFRDVFAVPEFRVVLGSFALHLIAESVKMLALSVLVYAGTGSPLLAALAYVAGFLPQALGGTFLLALADRWRPRRLMVAYELVRFVTTAVLALGVLDPPGAMLLVFAVGSLAPLSHAARSALVADLLDGDAYVLGRSLFTVVSGSMQVVGAGAGGLLLTVTGPSGALWLATAACLVSAAVVRFGLRDHPARSTESSGAIRRTWQVNRALLGDPAVRGLLLAHWLPVSLMVGAEGVLIPYAEKSAGVLLAASAGGMLVGEALVARLLPARQRERLTPWIALLCGLPLLAFLARPDIPVAAVLLALATAGSAYQLGLARRFLGVVPEDRRGQAFGLLSTGVIVAQGLTMAGAGAIAELLPAGTTIAIAGTLSIAATMTLWHVLRSDPAEVLS
jgi:predicted MFS family arabinose efflux permease